MPGTSRSAGALALFAFAIILLSHGCRTQDAPITPDKAFTPYIPAFTAGHISARAPIVVRIAEGQQWKDSSDAAIQDLFTLDPKVQGTVRWHDQHTLAFHP
ncbi:MAG: hypothetical protein H6590_06705, partial [Flavobacteriales bacterium]|nr:hypothetical protein [Flavobacteriales bacterium]